MQTIAGWTEPFFLNRSHGRSLCSGGETEEMSGSAAAGNGRIPGGAAMIDHMIGDQDHHGRSSWASTSDTTNLCTSTIVQSNHGSSSIDRVIDWSQIEIAPANEDEFVVPIEEENVCSMLGINDKFGHRRAIAGAAIEASIANINACMDDIDEDLLADAALPVPDHMPEEKHFWYDKEHPVIEEGSLFPSMEEFRMLLRTFAIRGKFDIQIQDSDTTRFIGHCKGKICHWRIMARTTEDGKTVRVNKIVKPHNCSSTAEVISSMADQAWVAEKSIGILRTEPNIGAGELQKRLKTEYQVTTGYQTVWRAKEKAMDKLYGTWGQSFQNLWNFKAEIEKRSPDSIVEVDVKSEDGKVYFSRFFMALKPCIDGFLNGCRPYVSIDSTFMNGKWNGQLAACTALDGHNWMFPLAFGFFASETEDNWTWFMQQLHKAIGHLQNLAICTDACKGLENAVRHVFPRAEQRECFRHLMANFKKKFHGDVFGRMWPAAKAYRVETFNYHMAKIFEAEPEVGTYLSTYHNLKWMRCDFNMEIKCDYIHNNLAESFNSWIRGMKDLPPDELADSLREKIMKLFHRRREVGKFYRGIILPAIIQQINNRTRELAHLDVGRSTGESCEVKDTNKNNLRHVVKIGSHECTCLEWQHTGKPCDHALAFLIGIANTNFHPYVHDYYSVSTFRAAYAGEIEPITDKSQWPQVTLDFEMVPPISKRPVGRQRKLRIKGCLEDGGSKSKGKKRVDGKGKEKDDEDEEKSQENGVKGKGKDKKRFGTTNRCKQCGQLGHRKTTCPENEPTERKKKVKKVNKGEDQLSREVIQQEVLSSAVGTPKRTTITLPPSLHDSPGPITRRRLAMAMDEDGASQSPVITTASPAGRSFDVPSSSNACKKKLTPKRRKL